MIGHYGDLCAIKVDCRATGIDRGRAPQFYLQKTIIQKEVVAWHCLS